MLGDFLFLLWSFGNLKQILTWFISSHLCRYILWPDVAQESPTKNSRNISACSWSNYDFAYSIHKIDSGPFWEVLHEIYKSSILEFLKLESSTSSLSENHWRCFLFTANLSRKYFIVIIILYVVMSVLLEYDKNLWHHLCPVNYS